MTSMKKRARQWFCGAFKQHPYRSTILKNNANLLTEAPEIVSETCTRCGRRLQ